MRPTLRSFCLCLTLAACGQYATNSTTMPATQAPPSASLPPNAPITFATELAGPGTFLPPLPTAVVILKPDDMARNRAFCRAAMQLPTAQQAEATSVIAPNLIRTRWLVQLGDVPRERATDCDFLVGTYDYARAVSLIASIRSEGGDFSGRGPYLLMIIPDRNGLRVAGLNGSATPDEAMPTFIAGWSSALSQTEARIAQSRPGQPGLLRSTVNLVAAILATVGGGAAGLVRGVFAQL